MDAAAETWAELARARAAGGETLVLRRRGGIFEIRCDGWDLMSNRAHHSEQALGQLGCAGLAGAPRVLIGGLGMGYTLRAALDVLPRAARVTVAEVFAAVADWNRGPLAALAGRPLDDPRVEVCCADVAALLAGAAYDAILLDVDNGPEGMTQAVNDDLYSPRGLAAARAALRRQGVLAVWSQGPDRTFAQRFAKAGFAVEEKRVRARGSRGGTRHVIWLGVRG